MVLHPVGMPVGATRRLEWRVACLVQNGRAHPVPWSGLRSSQDEAAELVNALRRVNVNPITSITVRDITVEHRTIWETPWTRLAPGEPS